MNHQGTPARRRRFKRPRGARAADGGTVASLQDALAELVLLREENARLSAARHEPPSLGRLVSRARSLGTGQDGGDDGADEAAQMFVEGVVLCESLMEVCEELERSIAAVKARLSGMGAEAESLDPLRRRPDDDPATAQRTELEDVFGGPAGGG
jgi:hypothetical protein